MYHCSLPLSQSIHDFRQIKLYIIWCWASYKSVRPEKEPAQAPAHPRKQRRLGGPIRYTVAKKFLNKTLFKIQIFGLSSVRYIFCWAYPGSSLRSRSWPRRSWGRGPSPTRTRRSRWWAARCSTGSPRCRTPRCTACWGCGGGGGERPYRRNGAGGTAPAPKYVNWNFRSMNLESGGGGGGGRAKVHVRTLKEMHKWYVTCARNYRPCFRENQPKRSFSIKWKRAFWACFRENWVYKFGHWYVGRVIYSMTLTKV